MNLPRQTMKYADLHIHTFYSDSTFSPEEVAFYAKDKELSAIAICDHDSIDGIGFCKKAAEPLGIEVIPGIELTVEKADAEIHLLGYFIDWEADWFQKKLKEMQEGRRDRMRRMVEKLAEHNIDVNIEDVFKSAGKGSVGRLHLAQTMIRTGKARGFKEAFEKYRVLFHDAGVEIRPIIAGNMLRQPFYKKHVKATHECVNADHIHRHGFYFGNNPELTAGEIRMLQKLVR